MHLVRGSLISLDADKKCYPKTDYMDNRLEEKYTKEILNLIINKLVLLGYKATDCTPWDNEFYYVGDFLRNRVKNINSVNSILHLAINLNYSQKKTIEFWVGSYGRPFKFAENISKEFLHLQYYNKGIRIGENYLIEHSKVPIIIIKCSLEENMEEFKSIANIIVKAITS